MPIFSRSPLDATMLRRHVLHMANSGNSVHVGCAFSMIEILVALYNDFVAGDANDPTDPERDFVLLSKGHGVMAVYACYRELGWLPQEDLDRYFSDGSRLHGLSEWKIPGFEVSGGSLGHGLPIAAGIALGLKWRGRSQQKVYCIVGDGEMNEGTMWESLLFANQQKLDNLVVIVDANGFQAMGEVASIIDMEPFVAKFESFGFEALECNGHDPLALGTAFEQLAHKPRRPGSPKALIARTIKGKGVSFMENNNQWHYLRLDSDTLAAALKELE